VVKNKKLLVLGGTSASLDVVRIAKDLGVYTIVTDDRPTGVSKDEADEAYMISTTDMDGLLKLIKQRSIDGVFCGPSEFNILNTMRLCKLAGLPFYFTPNQWEICQNKASFKSLCKKYGVPCVPDYSVEGDVEKADLSQLEYPVIVKPVDSSGSRGITVCYSEYEVRKAYIHALSYSKSKRVIIEKYIENNGEGLSVWYIVCNGEASLSLTGDKYVIDPVHKTALTSAVTIYPSKYTEEYIETIDANVRDMVMSIGLRNGVFFLQALIDNGKIYFHEMGLRLSGGLIYKITEPTTRVNDVKMMIRYALGGPMCTSAEKAKISPYLNGKCGGSLCFPLKAGTISLIEGVEEIKNMEVVTDFIQYCQLGDEITEDKVGTMSGHFGRLKIIAENKKDVVSAIEKVQDILIIKDQKGEDMIYKRFDTNRLIE